MKRRDLLKGSLAGLVAAPALKGAAPGPGDAPTRETIPVAFLLSEGAVVIDFTGPWEVFQDAIVPGRRSEPFRLFTVARTRAPIRTSGGMQIVPDYDFATAPQAKI